MTIAFGNSRKLMTKEEYDKNFNKVPDVAESIEKVEDFPESDDSGEGRIILKGSRVYIKADE
ncbi:MAG TPA: hypothetical protein PK659_10025 [Methanothrix sp.]|nr:hypothetical protein [Methanothrix sp.]HOL44578.1 hypothetical protein [Methanothrix sp.]